MAAGPDPRLVPALEATLHRLLERLGDELRPLGLSQGEINALAQLRRGSTRTVAEVQRATGQRASTLTGILDRLEGRGLIRRRPNPHDRRSFTISLTPAGARAATRVRRAFADIESAALARVTESDAEGFFVVLAALDETADA
jgi:DNA-binding MarR family transcriptional regulator